MVENILIEMESLQGRPLEQFLCLSEYLKNRPGKIFDSKLTSRHPLDIKLRVNLSNMITLLDASTANLVQNGTSYIVDKNKTLYVHIEETTTLQLMTGVLLKVVVNMSELSVVENQLVAI